jgi:hypothetical protein
MTTRRNRTTEKRNDTAETASDNLDLGDRRHYTRLSHAIELDCKVDGAGTGRIVGLSIGGGGLRVITTTPLPFDRSLPLEFSLGDTEEPIVLRGKVIWQERLENLRSYISGIKFTRIGKDIRRRITTFVSNAKGMA